LRNRPHTHLHFHKEDKHDHQHAHIDDHTHPHPEKGARMITPWALFIIFVFGPCEPLIPILMYPAVNESLHGVVMVAGVFSVVTISTMLVSVLLLSYGISWLPTQKLERYNHAVAGATILACGIMIHIGF